MRAEMVKVDRWIDPPFGIEDWRTEPVEVEPAAALPTHCGRNPALFAIDHFAQARHAMGDGVVTHFDADIAAAHFVGDGRCGAGAEEGVEDEVAGIGG